MATTPDPNAPSFKQLTPKQQIAARYPAFSGLFGTDQEKAALVAEFGQQLVDLLLDVVNHPKNYDLVSTEGIKAFDALVSTTDYVKNTIKTQREFELMSPTEQEDLIKKRMELMADKYGELGIDQTKLRELATTASKNGYAVGSISERHMVNMAVAKTSQTGAGVLSSSTEAQTLRDIAKSYNYRPANLDKIIQNIMTGTPDENGVVQTADSLKQAAKQTALGMYPHLKMQLDAGSTLEDVFGTYKQMAASLLEVPDSSIDLSNPLYAAALGKPDTGVMSLGDWETLVKSDRRYGYQYTKKANQDASNMAFAISRAFGKVQ